MTDELDQIATALALAQAEMTNAALNKANPYFKSKYADLASVREATLPALNKHGLAIVQYTDLHFSDGELRLILRTKLLHKSGQSISSAYPIANGKPQEMGSALTYARRYSWAGLCGIASEEDDDGNLASAAPKKSASKARADGDYEGLVKAIQAASSTEALQKLWLENMGLIKSLPDNWQTFVREAKEVRKIELTEGVGEDGKATFEQRLKASANAEGDA
jgi:hypothetical protein